MAAKGQTIEAINLAELASIHGQAKAAQLLGISPGAVSDYLKNNETRVPIELLAGYLLREAGGEPKILIAKVPQSKLEGVRHVLAALGITFSEL